MSTCIEPVLLASTPDVFIVDVRSPEEFAAGHVKGATNIPIDTLAEQALALLPKGRPIVTVCGSGGGRSEHAAAQLRAFGFDAVRSLCGGTQAWLQLTY